MLVPKLRFNEFTDEWIPLNLKTVFEYYSTNSFTRENLADKGSIQNIHYGDIHRKYESVLNVENTNIPYLKDSTNFKKGVFCRDGDIIFADASEDYDGIGKAIEINNIKSNYVVSGLHTIHARDVGNQFALGFKGYLFNSPNIHNQIRILANGFKVFGISKNTINSLNIKIPSIKEQEKIAKLLLLLDKKIQLQQAKIDALKLYKLCLENNIFDSVNFKEADMKKCFKSFGGTSLEKYTDYVSKYNFVSIGNYTPDGKYMDNGQRIKLNDKSREKLLKRDELVMILNDKTAEGRIIGSTILIDKDNQYIYNQRSQRLVCNENIITPKYAWFYLNSRNFRKKIINIVQGGTQIYINFSSVEKIKILIPQNTKDMKLIANIMCCLFNKIDLEKNKLTKLEHLKKGFMQQLFV